MLYTSLWSQFNYKMGVPYIISTYMREYDLSKANISALYTLGAIDQNYYNYLSNVDKYSREVLVGLMIKDDSTIYDKIQEGILDAKKQLFDSNSIKEEEVLSIRNDSVTVIGRPLKETVFGNYVFKLKGLHTVYFKLLDLEFFYHSNPITKEEEIEVKGMSDECVQLHLDGMVGLLCNVADLLQRSRIEDTLHYIMDTYESYLNRSLPIEYYRELNSESKYRFETSMFTYMIDGIKPEQLKSINIDRNLLILRNLIQIVSSIYSERFKKG